MPMADINGFIISPIYASQIIIMHHPPKIDLRKQINFCGEVKCAKISPGFSSVLIFGYIRPLSKLASGRKMVGDLGARRTRVYLITLRIRTRNQRTSSHKGSRVSEEVY